MRILITELFNAETQQFQHITVFHGVIVDWNRRKEYVVKIKFMDLLLCWLIKLPRT